MCAGGSPVPGVGVHLHITVASSCYHLSLVSQVEYIRTEIARLPSDLKRAASFVPGIFTLPEGFVAEPDVVCLLDD